MLLSDEEQRALEEAKKKWTGKLATALTTETPPRKVELTYDELDLAISKMATEIFRDFKGHEITLLPLLTGAIVPVSILQRELAKLNNGVNNPHERATVLIEPIDIHTYGENGTTKEGTRIYGKPWRPTYLDKNGELCGKNIIIVDDIYDSGDTIKYLKKHINSQGGDRDDVVVKTCCLINRSTAAANDKEPLDYCAFNMTDERWVVGGTIFDISGYFRDRLDCYFVDDADPS